MRALATLLRGTNRSLSGIGRVVSAEYLPSFLHGRVIWLARECWETSYLRYEPHMAHAIREYLPHGGVFYDVGAHIGLWSLYAAAVAGAGGRVVSFEPSEAFTLLQRNTRRVAHVERHRVAVGERSDEVVFHGQGLATSGSLIRSVTELNRTYSPEVPIEAATVRLETLDVLADGGRDPDLIKVDVEGYEAHVLAGARRLIDRASPTWLIEIHPPQLRRSGSAEQACIDILERSGYAIDVIARNPNTVYTVLATRVAALPPLAFGARPAVVAP